MSSAVENRILGMRFDNTQFQGGVSSSIGILDKLKAAISGLSTNGIDKLASSAKRFSLANMVDSTHKVSAGFTAMATVGITALATLTNKAVNAGIDFVKSFTFGPILDGFNEYELKMGSIQTILANTSKYGTKLGDVNKALNELNHYADKTIYNFGDMTKNVGLFTNAGIKLEDATSIIKGFSNEAAASGTSSQGAAAAAYQLSQALSAGTIRLMDFKSLTNVGLGNANMKDGLLDIASAMGEVESHGTSAEEIQSNFNGTLEKGWLTADVMSNYLKIMAGDMTKAEQAALGLSDAQIKAFSKQQQTAEEAATKVRTLSQLMGTLREAVGSSWSSTFNILFGNFNEATDLFTAASNTIGGFVNNMGKARNSLLRDWKQLGGRTALIDSIVNVFHALISVIKPVRDAFGTVFPPATGEALYNFTILIRDFTAKLAVSAETANSIKSIFTVLFTVIKIGYTIMFGIIKSFASLGEIATHIIGPLFNVIGAITGIIAKLLGAGDAASGLGKIFDAGIALRAKILTPIADFIGGLLNALAGLISTGGDKLIAWLHTLEPLVAAASEKFKEFKSAAADFIGPLVDSIKQLASAGAGELVDKIASGFSKLGPILSGIGGTIKGVFAGIGGAVGGLSGISLGSIFDFGDKPSIAASGVNQVKNALSSTAGVADKVRTAWEGVKNVFQNAGNFFGPILDGIAEFFSTLKERITGYVQGLGFQDILAIVNTVFLSALYLTIKSFVKNLSEMSQSIKAISEAFKAPFEQLTSNLKTMQNDVKANIILKIAAAILVLAVAMLILSKIPAEDMGRALVGLTLLILLVVGAMKAMVDIIEKEDQTWQDAGKQALMMTAMGAALIALGLGILAIAFAVKILSGLSVDELKKGLISVGLILGSIVLAAAILSKTGGAGQILIAAAALGILAGALIVFAGAVKLYSAIKTETLLEGGLKIVATIAAIGLAMRAFPSGALGIAASLIIVAVALTMMAGVIKLFSLMPVEDITKGLIALAATLVILVAAMEGFQSSVAGALALVIVAGALTVLIPVIERLAAIPILGLVKAIAALAAIFVVLGLAGTVLTPLVPIVLGLAAALALIGAAIFIAGAGVLLFATGLGILAVTGTAGFAVITGAIVTFLQLLPLMIQQFGLALRALAAVIQTNAEPLATAIGTLLRAILNQIIKTIPVVGRLFLTLLKTANAVVRGYVPDLINTGIYLITQFLLAIRKNIGPITQIAIDILVRFIDTIRKNMDRIVTSAINLITTFFNALGRALRSDSNKASLKQSAKNVAGAIIDGIVGGLQDGLSAVVNKAKEIAGAALNALKDKFKINSPSKETQGYGRSLDEGLTMGMDDHAHKVAAGAGRVADGALSVMRVALNSLSDMAPDEIDINPRVTPILDLTKLQNEATKIGSMLATDPLTVATSYNRASDISNDRNAAAEAALAALTESGAGAVNIKVEQTNTSPKALSPVDVYRATKSALAVAKGAMP